MDGSQQGARLPPTILFVSPVAHCKGGAETVLLDMLASPFLRPALAVPGEGDLARQARARSVPVGFFDLGAVGTVQRQIRARDAVHAARDTLHVARQLTDLARDLGADLVQTNGLKVHVAGCLARLLHGTPTVVHMHDVAYSRAERLIWGGLARTAAHTIMASDICYPAASRRPNRFSLVMQGVDVPPEAAPRLLPARPTIGLLGRFHWFKGVHLLLDWFEAAMDVFPTLDLLLRGRPGEEGSAYWAGLQPQVRRLVAAGRCRVEDWRPAHENPFAGVDLLVAPSSTPEVGPRVVMEAMARGIPAIGYPAGGILHMITSPEVGALAADAAAFRAALHRLLQPATYAAASAAALAHARAEFGLHRFWHDLSRAHTAALAGAAVAAL
jgi:glycosyltransferase involved in cell wall biosynthesis